MKFLLSLSLFFYSNFCLAEMIPGGEGVAAELPSGLTIAGSPINDLLPTVVSVPVVGGDFTGTAKLAAYGDQIVFIGLDTWTHASLSTATSSVGVIPIAYRPSVNVSNVYTFNSTPNYATIKISTAGTITVEYINAGPVARTDSISAPTLTYNL